MTGDEQAAGDLRKRPFCAHGSSSPTSRLLPPRRLPPSCRDAPSAQLPAISFGASRVVSTLFAGTILGSMIRRERWPSRIACIVRYCSSAHASALPSCCIPSGTLVRRAGAGAWHLALRCEGDTLAARDHSASPISRRRNRWRLNKPLCVPVGWTRRCSQPGRRRGLTLTQRSRLQRIYPSVQPARRCLPTLTPWMPRYWRNTFRRPIPTFGTR